jgi:Fe2+ transport system protein FeoA
MKLSELKSHRPAEIVGFLAAATAEQKAVIRSLMELGLTAGATIEICHYGPLGRDPLTVTCRGALIGLGKKEAALVLVTEKAS